MNQTKTIRALLALSILLALAVSGIGIAWAVTAHRQQASAERTEARLENTYRQQYFQLCYNLANLSDYLNKLLVTASPTLQMQLLGQINVEAASAGAAVSGLVAANAHAGNTTRYINQVGDYCLRLQYALAEGGRIGDAEHDNLVALYSVLREMERRLEEVREQAEQGNFSFLSDGEDNVFAMAVADFEAATVSYPALIYDGPFSDALALAEPMGVTGRAITREEAEAKVGEYLPTQFTLSFEGELGGSIPAYRFSAETAHGTYWLDVTQVGGHLLHMAANASPQDTVYSAEDCRTYGQQYLAHIGIANMQAVWVSNYNSVYYVNYAYVQDDVVCYSDLIVLKISAETMTLVGVEARNYLMNHHARTMESPAVTTAEATNTVHRNIQIDGVRMALIPTEGGNERLCYEVAGLAGDDRYFVYVDAHTGREYKILRVIDSQEGQLLR